jgi:hypothetical protein
VTVPATTNRIAYAGNGVTLAFAFPYFLIQKADMKVYSYNTSTGVITGPYTHITDYTISGTAAADGTYPSGVTVNMIVAPATGTKLVLVRDPDFLQSVHWVDADPDPSAVKELAFDKLTLEVQRLKDQMARTFQLPDGFAGTFSPVLDDDLIVANYILVIDATGAGFKLSSPSAVVGSATGLLAAANNLSDVANTATSRINLGLEIGVNVQAYDADLAALAALAATGIIVRTGAGTVAARTVTAPAAGITVSNGDGVAGNPTLALANDLAALEALGATGIAARTAADTWAQRSIVASDAQLVVTQGDGVAGNPTLALGVLAATTWSEQATPANPGAGNRKLYFKSDGNLYKLSSGGLEAVVGAGGGGGSLQWVEDVNAPTPLIENSQRVYAFQQVLGQALYAAIRVPSTYAPGSQINLRTLFYSPDSAGNCLIKTVATLIRTGTDAITSTANQRTSTNTTATLAAGTVNKPQAVVCDLTSSSGQINGVSVAAGDLILVQLTRDVADTATSDAKMPVYGTEVSFA